MRSAFGALRSKDVWPRATAPVALSAIALLLVPAGALAATRLCIQSVALPFPAEDPRFAMLEEKIAGVFRAGSFAVTGSAATQEMAERVDETWGEIFDPYSGRVVAEKKAQYDRELARGFREELDCDGRVRIAVVSVRARFYNYVASWDGVRHQVMSTGRAILMALGGVHESGWVAALSLWVHLMDPEGNDIAFRSAGIEPLVQFTVLRGTDKLPEDRWLQDIGRLDEAIASALGPGARRLRDQGTSRGPIAEGAIEWPGAQ